ncbi:MAG: NUDIX domain-containing protein [Nocardioidaceae bacterium]
MGPILPGGCRQCAGAACRRYGLTMSIYGFRQRVTCYVTRQGVEGVELLVFEHIHDDPADPSGVQVPGGGMMRFESIQDAAHREVEEETGLRGITYVGQLGAQELGLDEPGGPSVTTFVHVRAPDDGERHWEHVVHGDDNDGDVGMRFTCRWEPLPLKMELAAGQGAFLHKLPTH